MVMGSFDDREMEGPPDYVLVFDGGSQGNPGPGYGSYALIRVRDKRKRLRRLDFGKDMTNNEAEYEALVAGLEDIIETITAAGRDVGQFSIEVRGDSRLVINQVKGTWKARDARMRARRNRVWELLNRFAAYALETQPREEIVQLLGH